jgi:hypothetical protein
MRTVVSAGRRLGAALLLGLLALWLFTASAHGAAGNEVVLTLERGYGGGETAELARELDGRVLASIPALRAYLVTLGGPTDRTP